MRYSLRLKLLPQPGDGCMDVIFHMLNPVNKPAVVTQRTVLLGAVSITEGLLARQYSSTIFEAPALDLAISDLGALASPAVMQSWKK